MGHLLAIVVIAAIIFGPAFLILRSKGPTWTTKILWAMLSLSAAIVLLGGEPLLVAIGYQQPSDQFAIFSGRPSRHYPVLYGVPIATYVMFRLIVMARYR